MLEGLHWPLDEVVLRARYHIRHPLQRYVAVFLIDRDNLSFSWSRVCHLIA